MTLSLCSGVVMLVFLNFVRYSDKAIACCWGRSRELCISSVGDFTRHIGV